MTFTTYTQEEIDSIREWRKSMTPVAPLPKMVIPPLLLGVGRDLDGWSSPWTGEPLAGRTHGKSHITGPPLFTFRLKPARPDPRCEQWWKWRKAGLPQFPRGIDGVWNRGYLGTVAYQFKTGTYWSGRLVPQKVDIGGIKVERRDANKIEHLVNTGPK